MKQIRIGIKSIVVLLLVKFIYSRFEGYCDDKTIYANITISANYDFTDELNKDVINGGFDLFYADYNVTLVPRYDYFNKYKSSKFRALFNGTNALESDSPIGTTTQEMIDEFGITVSEDPSVQTELKFKLSCLRVGQIYCVSVRSYDSRPAYSLPSDAHCWEASASQIDIVIDDWDPLFPAIVGFTVTALLMIIVIVITVAVVLILSLAFGCCGCCVVANPEIQKELKNKVVEIQIENEKKKNGKNLLPPKKPLPQIPKKKKEDNDYQNSSKV